MPKGVLAVCNFGGNSVAVFYATSRHCRVVGWQTQWYDIPGMFWEEFLHGTRGFNLPHACLLYRTRTSTRAIKRSPCARSIPCIRRSMAVAWCGEGCCPLSVSGTAVRVVYRLYIILYLVGIVSGKLLRAGALFPTSGHPQRALSWKGLSTPPPLSLRLATMNA